MTLRDSLGPKPETDEHDAQLVAIFEDRRVAEGARYALLSAGIPADAVEMIHHEQSTLEADDPPQAEAPPAETGFWAALGRLFAPHEEAHALSRAVGQGHVMVVVHPADAAEREVAIEVLEGCGPLDLDERREHTAGPAQMVRVVEERMRVGWRDRPDSSGRVRQYLAAKPQERQRVELQEDEMTRPGDPATPS